LEFPFLKVKKLPQYTYSQDIICQLFSFTSSLFGLVKTTPFGANSIFGAGQKGVFCVKHRFLSWSVACKSAVTEGFTYNSFAAVN